MPLTIENLLVLAIVSVATAYLARRAWTTLLGKRKPGCGACATCPATGVEEAPQVISVETLISSSGSRIR